MGQKSIFFPHAVHTECPHGINNLGFLFKEYSNKHIDYSILKTINKPCTKRKFYTYLYYIYSKKVVFLRIDIRNLFLC